MLPFQCVPLHKKSTQPFDVTVHGISMNPFLVENEIVQVNPSASIGVGDVVVFGYGREGLLVHRVLRIQDGYYHIKGDNAFRVEIVPATSIHGKVVGKMADNRLLIFPDFVLKKKVLVFFSYRVHSRFVQKQNMKQAKDSVSYRLVYWLGK